MDQYKEDQKKDISKDSSSKSNTVSKTEDKQTKQAGKRTNSRRNKSNAKKTRYGQKNDPSWYIVDKQLVDQVGNLPYSAYPGITYSVVEKNASLSVIKGTDLQIPGIAVFKYIPTLNTNTNGRAVDLTAKALYQYIRRNTSGGAKVYQSSDVLMYILAMDSVYLAIHQVKRLLKLYNTYFLRNKSIPKAILQSLGVHKLEDFDYATTVAKLNLIISRANSMAVPKDFNLFKRRAVMGSIILTDELDGPTQILVPSTDVVYAYYSAAKNGGCLVGFDYFRAECGSDDTKQPQQYKPTMNTSEDGFNLKTISLDLAINNISQMLDRITFDDDMSIIGGDILRAYENNVFQIPLLDRHEVIELTYDEDLWQQFSNSYVVDMLGAYHYIEGDGSDKNKETSLVWLDNTTGGDKSHFPVMYQKGNVFYNAPFVQSKIMHRFEKGTILNLTSGILKNLLLTSDKQPTPELNMEWTRLMSFVDTPEASLDVDPTPDYKVISGVELGIGWLVYNGTTNLNQLNPGSSNYNMEQWFQYGNEWVADKSVVGSGSSTAVHRIQFRLIWNDNDKTLRVASLHASNAYMQALRHKPRLVPTHMGKYRDPGNLGKLQFDYEVNAIAGRACAYTALVSKTQITILHDTAVYGLLSNPQLLLK